MRKMVAEIRCGTCGKTAIVAGRARSAAVRSGRWYCSRGCSQAGKSAKLKARLRNASETVCGTCGKAVALTTAGARWQAKRRGYSYCSTVCRETGHRSRQAASLRGFKHTAETRAKMSVLRAGKPHRAGYKFSPEARARMSKAKRGWKPLGMHGVPTPTEARLLERLGPGWVLHHRVGEYVVDLANPDAKLALEADGRAHTRPGAVAQRARDAERDAFLRSQGWVVLRVTNKSILERR